MRRVCVLLLFLVTLPVVVHGQAMITDTITGTTKDQSGAAMPGVSVTLTSTATGRVDTAVSDEISFRFLVVQGSGYALKAELPGFKTVAVNEIFVRPGGLQRFDLTLEVGERSEEFVVTVEAPLVNLEASQVVEGLGQNSAQLVFAVQRLRPRDDHTAVSFVQHRRSALTNVRKSANTRQTRPCCRCPAGFFCANDHGSY